jgi:hypothetical protein
MLKIILSFSATDHVALPYVSTGLTVLHTPYFDSVNKKLHENRIENEYLRNEIMRTMLIIRNGHNTN